MSDKNILTVIDSFGKDSSNFTRTINKSLFIISKPGPHFVDPINKKSLI